MSVGDICNRNIAIIGKQDSIYAAARLMRDRHVNEVVAVESSKGINMPVGLLTDHDIVVMVLAERLDPDTVPVGDLLPADMLTANDNDDLLLTLKRMRHNGLRRIPVISQGKGLIGVLSIDHILDSLAEQLNDIDQIIIGEQNGTGSALHQPTV